MDGVSILHTFLLIINTEEGWWSHGRGPLIAIKETGVRFLLSSFNFVRTFSTEFGLISCLRFLLKPRDYISF